MTRSTAGSGRYFEATPSPRRLLAAGALRISVHDGVVTLCGNVPNRFHRRELVELVRRVEGVIDVVDRLYDDYEVRRSVERALRRSVPSARIRASSLLGRVALVGRTESQSEMERAIAVTRSLPGVRAVVNRIEVEALRPAV